MSVVQHPLEDRFAGVIMPVIYGSWLASSMERRPWCSLKFHEVMALCAGVRGNREVVEKQQSGTGELFPQLRIGAVAVVDAKLFTQTR